MKKCYEINLRQPNIQDSLDYTYADFMVFCNKPTEIIKGLVTNSVWKDRNYSLSDILTIEEQNVIYNINSSNNDNQTVFYCYLETSGVEIVVIIASSIEEAIEKCITEFTTDPNQFRRCVQTITIPVIYQE